MTKQELIEKVQQIILKTNGGNDDYVVALLQISQAINKLENVGECEIIDIQDDGWVLHGKCTECEYRMSNPRSKGANFCPNCGRKIKRGVK